MEGIIIKKNILLTISALAVSGNMLLSSQPEVVAATVKTTTTTTKKTTTFKITTVTKNKKYKDGVYKGSAAGYRGHGFNGTTAVSVTLKKDKITSIKIISIGDTPEFYQTPVEVIPDEIIKSQSTNVDVISGATFSSRGIINAVATALKKAKI